MIRPATINDIGIIVSLEEEIFGTTLGINFFENALTSDIDNVFVYELNKQIIGYISIRKTIPNAEILNFLVDNNYQRQGIGQSLLSFVLEYLKRENIEQVTLEVRKSNEKARKFYQKNGFTKAFIRKNYYENEDAYVYIKDVDL